MTAAGDPLGSGLVASLARPGGNVTGMSLMAPDLGGKRLELLKEVVSQPGYDSSDEPAREAHLDDCDQRAILFQHGGRPAEIIRFFPWGAPFFMIGRALIPRAGHPIVSSACSSPGPALFCG
jgi:hypothetical protein